MKKVPQNSCVVITTPHCMEIVTTETFEISGLFRIHRLEVMKQVLPAHKDCEGNVCLSVF